jgi:hypothetical protein
MNVSLTMLLSFSSLPGWVVIVMVTSVFICHCIHKCLSEKYNTSLKSFCTKNSLNSSKMFQTLVACVTESCRYLLLRFLFALKTIILYYSSKYFG